MGRATQPRIPFRTPEQAPGPYVSDVRVVINSALNFRLHLGRMKLRARLLSFLRSRTGSVLLIFGLGTPVIVLAIAAAVEYGSIAHRHTQLRRAVDGAALAAAQQLRIASSSDDVISAVASTTADTLTARKAGTTRTTTATIADSKRSSVRVSISESVFSVIGRVLTLPTSEISVSAVAKFSGSSRLCMLTLDDKQSKALSLEDNSRMTASGCLLQSNSVDAKGFLLGKAAQASAAVICSTGGFDNHGAMITGSLASDCPAVADPLASRERPNLGHCTGADKMLEVKTSITLLPGTYCKGLKVSGSAQVVLGAGTYVFNDGPLIVTDTAGITGNNVGFFFSGKEGGLRFDPNTTISLTAPKDGAMAGLLFFEDRTVSSGVVAVDIGPTGIAPPPPPPGSPPMRTYRISSNNAYNLLGTIYLPAGRLVIDAKTPVANKSAYTVVIVRQIDLNSGPNLYLNSDYAATDVPVPDGVGSKTGSVVLTQ